jgi:site-specific recombinase XerD
MNNKNFFEQYVAEFIKELEGKNSSALTITAYTTDIRQFLTFVRENNLAVHLPIDITKQDVTDFLADLSQQGRSGVTRARKLAAVKEFFLFFFKPRRDNKISMRDRIDAQARAETEKLPPP